MTTRDDTRGLVDLHCHLLPGVDDGPRDLDDSIGMVKQAEADGVSVICATPHIRADHLVAISELPARRSELSAALLEAGCRTRVLPGGEVAASMVKALDDHELSSLALGGGGRWILLEPLSGPLDARLEDAVDALSLRGCRALIAHPERHPGPDLVERLRRVIAKGALVQATAAFLTHEETREAMLTLGRAGVIHVLGSDSHSSRVGRRAELTAALDVLAGIDPLATHMAWVARAAPTAIVRGEDVVSPFPAGGA